MKKNQLAIYIILSLQLILIYGTKETTTTGDDRYMLKKKRMLPWISPGQGNLRSLDQMDDSAYGLKKRMLDWIGNMQQHSPNQISDDEYMLRRRRMLPWIGVGSNKQFDSYSDDVYSLKKKRILPWIGQQMSAIDSPDSSYVLKRNAEKPKRLLPWINRNKMPSQIQEDMTYFL
ncbi:hypothetical protein SNEBB_000578 [Seison nebaliae]|nr:hypothetical protein SNEBB_000578 [Seison nebaliae]